MNAIFKATKAVWVYSIPDNDKKFRIGATLSSESSLIAGGNYPNASYIAKLAFITGSVNKLTDGTAIKTFVSGSIEKNNDITLLIATNNPIYKVKSATFYDKAESGKKAIGAVSNVFVYGTIEDTVNKMIYCIYQISGGSNQKAGWINKSDLTTVYSGTIEYIPKTDTTTTNSKPVSKATKQKADEEAGKNTDGTITETTIEVEEEDGSGYQPETITYYQSSVAREQMIADESTYNDINHIRGVFGLPYQFLPSADGRIGSTDNSNIDTYKGNNTGIGMEFADKIIGKVPILFIAPGRSNFMTRYSKENKKTILQKILEDGVDLLDTTKEKLEDLLDKNGRYFTFEYNTEEYYKYVNPMCRLAARYLEIQDFDVAGQIGTLDNMDWSKYTNGSIFSTGTDFAHIPFYLDSDDSVNEDFGNSVTDSQLSSWAGGISDLGREIRFITGYSSEMLDSDWLKNNADVATHMSNISDAVNGILGGGNFIKNLTNCFSTVATGGRLVFPKIWGDSDFGRQYSVKIKLVSPDCNKLSIYLNILVPLFHLLGLVAPQTISGNPNGYGNPFLVRAIYKNFFNVDMGIITSMSVERGGSCMWTVDGLPTSIEVSLTIKDLYEYLAISATGDIENWKYDTLSNTAQMDYIANLCGINMYKPEIGRQISMWAVNTIENPILDLPRNFWKKVNSTIATSVQNIFR